MQNLKTVDLSTNNEAITALQSEIENLKNELSYYGKISNP